jgi:hypothetical protein
MPKGKGFYGIGGTSTANQELVASLIGWTEKPQYYKFSFLNIQACNVKVNGNPVYLRANQGFESDLEDADIKSFIIVESGIDFNYIGAY